MSILTEERRKLKSAPRPCKHCGLITTRFYALFCSRACYTAHRKPAIKACKVCGINFEPFTMRRGEKIHLHKRKTCSPECLQEERAVRMRSTKKPSGPAHHKWSGGKWWGRHDWRGEGWAQIRRAVRARAKYRCEKCGIPEAELTTELDVHHRIPFHNFNTARAANRMANLIAYCHSCHMVTEAETRLTSGAQMTLALTGDLGHAGRARGERSGGAKCTTEKALLVKAALKGPERKTEIAKRLDVSVHTVYQISYGKTWGHV